MVGSTRGQVNESDGVGRGSRGYLLQHRYSTQNARNRNSECHARRNRAKTVTEACFTEPLFSVRIGKKLRCRRVRRQATLARSTHSGGAWPAFRSASTSELRPWAASLC